MDDPTIARLSLPDGAEALIDAADVQLVAGFRWRRNAGGYVLATRGRLHLYLHRLIIGAGSADLVDHANGDPLDNRSANLRFATRSQNGANRAADRRRAGTTSRHKGVSWNRERSQWRAYIHVDGRTRSLGSFATEEEAACAYNRAAVEVWGEFARLNDVTERTVV